MVIKNHGLLNKYHELSTFHKFEFYLTSCFLGQRGRGGGGGFFEYLCENFYIFSFYVYFSRYSFLLNIIYSLDDVLNSLIGKSKQLFVIPGCRFVYNNLVASVFSISTHVLFKLQWSCVKSHTWFGNGDLKEHVSLPHSCLYHIWQLPKYASSGARLFSIHIC